MSDSDESKPKSRPGCVFYGVMVFLVGPIVLLFLAILTLVVRDVFAKQKLSDRRTAIEAQGLPVDSPSNQIYYNTLTSEENSQAWMAVLAQLESEEFLASSKGVSVFGQVADVPRDPNQPWPAEKATMEFVAKWEKLHQDTLKVAQKGGAVRFPIKFDSINTLLPEAQNMRGAARILKLRGEIAIRQGDADSLRENLDGLYGCGEVLDGDPILVSQLVSIAIDGVALDLLRGGLESGLLSKEDLKHFIEKSMARVQIGPQWKYSLYGERAAMLPIFEGESDAAGASGGPVATGMPFRGHDANTYLDLMDKAIEVDTTDLDEFAVGMRQVDQHMEARFTDGSIFQRFDNLLSGLLMPALNAMGNAFVREASSHRIAVLAMGTRLYQLENGEFPESLDDLKSLGLDPSALKPIGGKPFGYRVDDEGALLWGFDLQSDLKAVPNEPPELDGEDDDSARSWRWRVAK